MDKQFIKKYVLSDKKYTTEDEQIALLIVAYCDIGDVRLSRQTQTIRPIYNNGAEKVRTSLEFCSPMGKSYMSPQMFLCNKSVHSALKKGIFITENKKDIEAYQTALSYIIKKEYMK